MMQYLGVKLVEATPMSRGDYNQYRGWVIPKGENPEDPGFLVRYHDGYESWCPREQFEDANRPMDGMTFGHAIEAMRKGKRVARRGWNSNGIRIFLMDEAVGLKRPGYDGENCDIRLQQHIVIDTTGLQTSNPDAPKSVVPWLASQTDMLAEDWQILEA